MISRGSLLTTYSCHCCSLSRRALLSTQHASSQDTKAGGLRCQAEGDIDRDKNSCSINGNIQQCGEFSVGAKMVHCQKSFPSAHLSDYIGSRGRSVTHLVILPLASLAFCSGTPWSDSMRNCVIFQELKCYGFLKMSAEQHCWIRTIIGFLT